MGREGGAKERMRGGREERRGEEEGGSKGGCNEQEAAGNREGEGIERMKKKRKQKNMRSLIGDKEISRR